MNQLFNSSCDFSENISRASFNINLSLNFISSKIEFKKE